MRTAPPGSSAPRTRYDALSWWAGVLAASIGAVVLVAGWGFRAGIVGTALPGGVAMKPNTAIALVLLGIALWSRRTRSRSPRAISDLCALAVVVLGAATALEYLTGWNLRIDELIVRDFTATRLPLAGRMALVTAVVCMLMAVALLLAPRKKGLLAGQCFAGAGLAAALLNLVANLFGVRNLFGFPPDVGMAIHTSVALVCLGTGILLLRPSEGLMAVITSAAPGGVMSRRLLPMVILIPPSLGWVVWFGQKETGYSQNLAFALFACANISVLALFIFRQAAVLNRLQERLGLAENRLQESELRYREMLFQSPVAVEVLNREGETIAVNPAFERLFGAAPSRAGGGRRPQFERAVTGEVVRASSKLQTAIVEAGPGSPPVWIEVTAYPLLDPAGSVQEVVLLTTDVTDRETAVNALRESEAQFRQIADALPHIVWTARPAGDLDYFNRRTYDYTGRSFDDLREGRWLTALHPEDREPCSRRWAQCIAAGTLYEMEYRIRRASDGAYRWHLGRAVPIRNTQGEIVHWFGSCTDIEDYKRAEAEIRSANERLEFTVRKRTEELRKSEERYGTLIKEIKDYAILMLDRSGCVASWNGCAETTKGYTEEEILGKHFSIFYLPEDIERGHPQEILRMATVQGHYEEEGWRVRKDGSRFWASVSITALRDENYEVTGYSKVTRDITERAIAEERLKQSEQKFRAMLESAPDAFVIAAADGHIALVNAQAERLFGYGREELIGQPVEILIPVSARTQHRRNREIYAFDPRTRQMGTGMLLRGLRKDGSDFPVEVSLSPIQTPEASWVAAAIRDVTERVAAEEQLIAERRRAEEANRSKSNFLAAMSHEIRTPMNAILGMSDLLWESELDDEQRQYVEVFRRAGSNLLILINDILDLSKIESGHFELESAPFSLDDVVSQAAELVAPRTRKKGLKMITAIAPDAPNHLVGDPTRLRQVLINLLGNAVKFTETGEVRLAVRALPEPGGAGMEFIVSDSGIGIPAEKLEAIFDDFTQADSTTTRQYGGTGLGLSISRRIVAMMGGALRVESTVGKGSTFRFEAHFQAGTAAGSPAPEEVADFHGRRVALVDDNPTNRLIQRETLSGWGLVSVEFGQAADALRAIAAAPGTYALLVLDRNLPDMDGFDAAQKLVQIAPALPVIMLSSELLKGDAARWRQLGLVGYAMKPVKRSELFRLVCTGLRDRQPGAVVRLAQGIDHPRSQPLAILVAEDSADNRLLVEAYMKGSPHRLTFAEDGRAAVEQFSAGAFDLVLMDVQMPVMDGLSAAREIRALERQRGETRVPMIALTAHATQRDIERSAEAGCDLHLAKPISKSKLFEAIGRLGLLGGRQPIYVSVSADIEDLVPQYLAHVRQQVGELRGLLAASDFQAVAASAHNIKGTGTSYGFPDVTRIGTEIERAAKASQAVPIDRALAELADFLSRVEVVPG